MQKILYEKDKFIEELRETVKLSTGDSRLRTRRIDKKKPIAIIVPEG